MFYSDLVACRIPASPEMGVHRFLFILLSVFSLHVQPLSEATDTMSEEHRSSRSARGSSRQWSNTTGFILEYTLTIANSPDCEPSLVDNFPVRVQYRTIVSGSDGDTSVSEWTDSPNVPGD